MAAAVYLWWRPVASTRNNYRAWQWVLISMVGAVAFVAAGMSAMRPFYVSGSPSEHPFLHRQISDTPLAKCSHTSSVGLDSGSAYVLRTAYCVIEAPLRSMQYEVRSDPHEASDKISVTALSLIETSPDSTYLVFVYSPTCPFSHRGER